VHGQVRGIHVGLAVKYHRAWGSAKKHLVTDADVGFLN
jgi:hypothetical protein